MRKRPRNSKRQSCLIRTHLRLITSMPVPASPRANSSGQPRFLNARQKTSRTTINHCLLIPTYRSLGRHTDSQNAARRGIERAERELTIHPENARPAYLGAAALATLGETDRAREWATRALAIDPDDVLTQYNVACVYSILGDLEEALDLLERLLPNAGHELKHGWIKNDSDLDPLRRHPRFQKILELIG